MLSGLPSRRPGDVFTAVAACFSDRGPVVAGDDPLVGDVLAAETLVDAHAAHSLTGTLCDL